MFSTHACTYVGIRSKQKQRPPPIPTAGDHDHDGVGVGVAGLYHIYIYMYILGDKPQKNQRIDCEGGLLSTPSPFVSSAVNRSPARCAEPYPAQPDASPDACADAVPCRTSVLFT